MTDTSAAHPTRPSYATAAFWVVALYVAATAAETCLTDLRNAASPNWADRGSAIGVGIGIAAAIALAWRGRRGLWRWAGSSHAGVVLIGAAAVLTAVGTFLLQDAPIGEFSARYGAASPALRLLHLHDVFHGLGFRAVVGALALTSVVTVIQRRRTMLRWRNLGLLAAHVSLLLVMAGGLWGSLAGYKGMVHLRVGEVATTVQVSHGADKGRTVPLGFGLRLDRFDLAHYTPEFKVYTWKRTADGAASVVLAHSAKVGATVGAPAPGERVAARVVRVLRRAREQVTWHAMPGAHPLHHLTFEDGRRTEVDVGSTVDLSEGRRLQISEFVPDFTFDMESRRAVSRSPDPNNPALGVRILAADGSPSSLRFLFGRADLRDMMADHGDTEGLVYDHVPAARRDVRWVDDPRAPERAAVEIEVTERGQVRREFRLADEDRPIPFGTDRVLVYREKPDGIRNYKSLLTVVRGGRATASQTIVVNEPWFVDDVGLYQSNFDRDDPNYSGIQVVHDPGLALATFAMWLMVAAVFQALALRTWTPWWERRRNAGPGLPAGRAPGPAHEVPA